MNNFLPRLEGCRTGVYNSTRAESFIGDPKIDIILIKYHVMKWVPYAKIKKEVEELLFDGLNF